MYKRQILDWVPGHFPADDFALASFDGTSLYEHSDPREGYHQDWNTPVSYTHLDVYKRQMLQNEFTRTRGNSTDCTTTDPEIMHPPETSEFRVMP